MLWCQQQIEYYQKSNLQEASKMIWFEPSRGLEEKYIFLVTNV